VQYAAGGEISKKSGGYELHLWLIETASGKVLSELDKTGLTTLDSTAAVLGMAAAQFGQDLRSGKTDSLRATIRMGGIMVQSKQAGAAIFVDGQPRGRTPALVDSLLPGPHQVMLELEGYQRWYRTILAKRAVKDSIVAVLVLSVPGINSYQAPATAPQKTQPAVDEMVPDKNAYVAVDKNPEAIKQVQPVYPQQAKELGVSGKVYVQMLVDTDGHVIRADLAKSSGNASLDAAAIVAAKQWLFTPAIAPGGKPVRVWVMQAFTFKRD
jgi:TonB family protein